MNTPKYYLASSLAIVLFSIPVDAATFTKEWGTKPITGSLTFDATESNASGVYTSKLNATGKVTAFGLSVKVLDGRSTTTIRTNKKGSSEGQLKAFGKTLLDYKKDFETNKTSPWRTASLGKSVTLLQGKYGVGPVSVKVNVSAAAELWAEAGVNATFDTDGTKLTKTTVTGAVRWDCAGTGTISGGINIIIARVSVSVSGALHIVTGGIQAVAEILPAQRQLVTSIRRLHQGLHGSIDLNASWRILFWKKKASRNLWRFGDDIVNTTTWFGPKTVRW